MSRKSPRKPFVNPVGALRSMPGVPKTSPEAALRNPFRNHLWSMTRALECRSPHRELTPEASPESPRVPSTTAGRVSPDVARVATCPECPNREPLPGISPSAPRAREPHREITPGTRRARHVSPGVIPFQPI